MIGCAGTCHSLDSDVHIEGCYCSTTTTTGTSFKDTSLSPFGQYGVQKAPLPVLDGSTRLQEWWSGKISVRNRFVALILGPEQIESSGHMCQIVLTEWNYLG